MLDENQNPVYKVKGKVFSITKKKYVCSMDDKKLFMVRNKWFNFFVHKAYIFDENKNKVATVKDKFFNVNKEYFVLGYKDEIKIEGDFFSLTCNILRNGEVIGTLRRKVTVVADAFELEGKEEDMPFLIALVIAIDNIVDKKRKN